MANGYFPGYDVGGQIVYPPGVDPLPGYGGPDPVPTVDSPVGTPGTTITTGPATAADLAAWYQNWLANDPTLQSVLAGINATGSAYKGQLGNQEAQLLEQYGLIPAGAGQYASFIDPTVAGIAQSNTNAGTSTIAQLARAAAQQHVSTLDNLAARGMLRSGATGVRENNDLTNANQASYDALQKLLSGLSANYGGYLSQQDQLNQEIAGANSTAMQRLTDLINNGTIQAPTQTSKTSVTTPSAAPSVPGAPSVGTAIPKQPAPVAAPVLTNPGSPSPTPALSAVASPTNQAQPKLPAGSNIHYGGAQL